MPRFAPRALLPTLHRWLGLILFPLFVAILLSGAILAIRPMVAPPPPVADAAVNIALLLDRLHALDPDGKARQIAISGDALTLLMGRNSPGGREGQDGPGTAQRFALSSGEALPVAPSPAGARLFATVERFHKSLLIGADAVVEIATYVLVAILALGPFLVGPHLRRRTLLDWHNAAGWVLLPLLALPPVTALLMVLHVGRDPLPPPAPHPPSPAQAIERAAAQGIDLSGLTGARRWRGGYVILSLSEHDRDTRLLVAGDDIRPMTGGRLIHDLHEGTWAGGWSGALNLVAALALLGLGGTGTWSWVARWRQGRRRTGAADAPLLIAHASQTGTAARLAETTARAFAGTGVACASLATLAPGDLARHRHVLLIASTTGDGVLADPGRAFLSALAGLRLPTVSFALLALGDRRHARFCAGGQALRQALLAAGAREFAPPAQADGDPAPTWRGWIGRIGQSLGLAAAPVEDTADTPVVLRLAARQRLDRPDIEGTGEAWRIELDCDRPADFRPGDLAMVAPAPGEPDRCYSIGSAATQSPGRVVLTVGRSGRMSGLLCQDLPLGHALSARLRRHAGFHPPADSRVPMILVATGCGIAPFVGFIAERAAAPQPRGSVWLLFGNRHRQGDFLYAEDWAKYLADGTLERLDTAFSRDPDDGAHVTARLGEHIAEILRRLREEGAILYVCGRRRLGESVLATLAAGLVGEGQDPGQAAALVRQWQALGLIRQDLFD